MRTLQEMKDYWETDLLADIEVLEQKRKKVVQKLTFLGIVFLCVIVVSFFVIVKNGADFSIIMFPVVISILIGIFAFKFISRGYVSEFKILVIERIIHFFDENLSYDRKGLIPKSIFMLSRIFRTTPNQYSGDDHVSGKVGATKIQFSELNAVHESGSGKNRSRTVVFKGLFFVGDFNKNFTCSVVVLPDIAEKLLGRIGQKLQSLNIGRDKLIKLDDPEFEKYFVVYSNDQVQARYILSTSLMKRIVDFRRKSDRKIQLSFIGSMVFVAISFTRNLFEPRIFRTLLDFAPVREYYEDLQLAIGIVDDLNLNTRIWTKR
jgi:hypothetical protein